MADIFPFDDPQDTAVFTCCHVTDGGRQILYVSHDDDGYWQFLCGGQHCEEDARLVSLRYIYKLDDTVGETAVLGRGQSAERSAVGEKWVVL